MEKTQELTDQEAEFERLMRELEELPADDVVELEMLPITVSATHRC